MSSLWTPGGEHHVPRDQPLNHSLASDRENDFDDPPYESELSDDQEEEIRRMQAEMLTVPASSVIANHVVNIFNLAMLHLFSQPANLSEAALAIDGASAIVEKLQGRLGDEEEVLIDAVHQMRLAYVQISGTALPSN